MINSDRHANSRVVADAQQGDLVADKTQASNGTFAARLFLLTLQSPIDAAGAIFFRIGFGIVMAWWAIDYLRSGQILYYYVSPRFHFTYWLFNWIHPWPGTGPYLHFVVLTILASFIAVGFAYRWSTVLFALGFSIFFLWDRTNYQNHYYLILLISWTLVFLPLNRTCSLDALQSSESSSPFVPVWVMWLLRFHVALPYVFGGIAKLNIEWLMGAGLRDYLVTKTSLPFVGPWLGTNQAAVVLAWSGLLLDLFAIPLLMWKRTRMLAYFVVTIFHICNHFLFSIHIFPWFMLMATTVFFSPDWPRRLLRCPPLPLAANAPGGSVVLSGSSRWGFAVLILYLGLQLILPFRHLAYGGDIGWHEQGHYFSWRMMLRTKRSAMRIYMTDPETGDTWNADVLQSINASQLERSARDPEMVLDLTHLIRDDYFQQTGRSVEVRALILTCYNGRKPQLLIDPSVDLAKEPRGFYRRTWIYPQAEPLPTEPWQRPMSEWQQAVRLPDLPKITRGPHGERIAPKNAALTKSF